MVQAEQADAALVVGVFDGLPQRCILLVRGVRARRGGVAREGEGAQFDSDHKSVARTASSAAEQLHYTRPKKGSVCSEDIQKWVYWWASNYASPGLTVLGRRSPGPPAPAQAGVRGAINYFRKVYSK